VVDVERATSGRVRRTRVERLRVAVLLAGAAGLVGAFFAGCATLALGSAASKLLAARHGIPSPTFAAGYAGAVLFALVAVVAVPLAWRKPGDVRVVESGGGEVRRWMGGDDA